MGSVALARAPTPVMAEGSLRGANNYGIARSASNEFCKRLQIFVFDRATSNVADYCARMIGCVDRHTATYGVPRAAYA